MSFPVLAHLQPSAHISMIIVPLNWQSAIIASLYMTFYLLSIFLCANAPVNNQSHHSPLALVGTETFQFPPPNLTLPSELYCCLIGTFLYYILLELVIKRIFLCLCSASLPSIQGTVVVVVVVVVVMLVLSVLCRC